MPGPSITATLGAAVADTPLDAIPAAALDAAKRLLIDHIGTTHMGAALTGAPLIAYARDLGGRPDAILFGTDIRIPAEMAAGINGQFCRATNYEDSGPGRHVGPLCVHTALAVAQRVGASGQQLVAAIALGYALSARFHFAERNATGFPHHRVSAAAIAARLLSFDADHTAQALSLAWEMPHRAASGETATRFIPGRISPLGTPGQLATPLYHARFGVQAALMVLHGFESVRDEIDAHRDDYDCAKLLSGLNFDDVAQMELKPWPCVRPGQCAIQALAELVEEHQIDPEMIQNVRLSVPRLAMIPHQNEPSPTTFWEAVYSLQWAATMVIRRVPPGPKWFAADQIDAARNQALVAKIELAEDPDSSRAYATLRRHEIIGTAVVKTASATVSRRCSLGETNGGPGAPMSAEMIESKFLEATSLSVTADHAHHLLERLRRVDDVTDVNQLFDG